MKVSPEDIEKAFRENLLKRRRQVTSRELALNRGERGIIHVLQQEKQEDHAESEGAQDKKTL